MDGEGEGSLGGPGGHLPLSALRDLILLPIPPSSCSAPSAWRSALRCVPTASTPLDGHMSLNNSALALPIVLPSA